MKFKSLHLKNLILVAIFALMSGSAWAQSVVSFGVYYGTEPCGYWIYYSIIQDPNYTNAVEVYNGGAYNNYSGAIEVPETVTHSDVTYTVCGVAAEAFYDTRTDAAVTSVSLPATVSYIGDRAFYQCKNMTTVNIPSAVTSIGSQAFFDCRKLMISEDGVLNIPNAVTTIGSYAFQACHALKNVTIGTGVTSIGEGAFMGCTGLETINYNAANCTSHGSSVWSGCTHTPCTLNIGNTVQSLPNSAFSGYSALTTLNFVATSQLTTISQYAFSGCTNIGAINIPNSVTSIEQSAFRNCEAATSLNLGSGVVTIGKAAFAYCIGLTSLDIPANVKTLESNDGGATGAFAYTGLTSLVIPNTLEYLGREAFANCPNLETVTIGTGVTYIGSLVFAGCSNLSVVNYNVTEIPSVADMPTSSYWIWNGCSSDCTVNIGDNVKGLPHDIFHGFTHLKTINFGSHANFSIGTHAFDGCTGLTTLTIPNNVITLDDYAFNGCTGLTTVNIGSGVTTIGSSAFSYCSELTSLDLSSVETIGSNAFSHCIALRLLTIPASVSEIQESGGANGAFSFCSNLEEIWFMGATRPTIASHTFDNVPNTALCYVPKGYANIATFTNVPYLRFVGGTDNNNNWNNASNWVGATDYTVEAAPANNEVVVIDGSNDPFIIENSTVKPSKIILGNGRKIKIDGGSQLVYNEPVQVTAIKYINGAEDWNTSSDGWYFIASPINSILNPTDVQGMITADNATVGHTFDLYKYVGNAVTYEGDPIPWQNYRVHSTDFHIENGAGYLYANSSDATLEFSGVTKAYTTSDNYVTLQYDGWNLIGNPYTFEVSADRDFVTLNNQAAVENQQYQHYVIKPCEGIAVYGSHGDKVYFSGDLPSSQSQNNSLNMVLTKANMRDAKRLDNAIVSFNEGEGMPKFNLMDQEARLYIPQDGKEYAIVHGEKQGVMPLNFVANENGEYAITVDVADVEMAYLHLIDNLTGADIDLLVEPSYTFEAKVSDYASRFRLVFISNTVLEDENGDDSFAFFSNGQLVIANQGRATLQVVDLTGRILSSETIDGSVSKTINATPGIYMLRLVNGDDVKVQKIVVR